MDFHSLATRVLSTLKESGRGRGPYRPLLTSRKAKGGGGGGPYRPLLKRPTSNMRGRERKRGGGGGGG